MFVSPHGQLQIKERERVCDFRNSGFIPSTRRGAASSSLISPPNSLLGGGSQTFIFVLFSVWRRGGPTIKRATETLTLLIFSCGEFIPIRRKVIENQILDPGTEVVTPLQSGAHVCKTRGR